MFCNIQAVSRSRFRHLLALENAEVMCRQVLLDIWYRSIKIIAENCLIRYPAQRSGNSNGNLILDLFDSDLKMIFARSCNCCQESGDREASVSRMRLSLDDNDDSILSSHRYRSSARKRNKARENLERSVPHWFGVFPFKVDKKYSLCLLESYVILSCVMQGCTVDYTVMLLKR